MELILGKEEMIGRSVEETEDGQLIHHKDGSILQDVVYYLKGDKNRETTIHIQEYDQEKQHKETIPIKPQEKFK